MKLHALSTRTSRAVIAAVTLTLAGTICLPASAQTPPAQPTSGPGGTEYSHADVRVSSGGTGPNAYFVFEPMSPKPASAPIVFITHGYFENSGYNQMHDFIMHTVKKGNVVIYPRYQTTAVTPCFGAFVNPEACMQSGLAGMRGGIAFLQADPDRVQPELDKASYFGLSFGGIITANLTNRWQSLNLPKPRVIYLDDPHDGNPLFLETAYDASMAGIPADALVACHTGSESVSPGGCNNWFPRLGHIPIANKNIVETFRDAHGSPALSSAHGVSGQTAAFPGGTPTTDAYDFYAFWKPFDAMRDCAFKGTNCQYALGDTPEHRFLGVWSDGVPVKSLKIQTAAPLVP